MMPKICLSTLTAILLPLAFTPEMMMAQTINFKPPSGGAPKTTTGAATRDQSCLIDSSQPNKKTLPILPQSNYGLTISSRPEFLIFKTKSTAKQIFLSLESEDEEQVYQTFLPLSSDVGFVKINFPSQAPDLVVNKKYKWTMTFICGKALRPDSPAIAGWIQRTAQSQALTTKLRAASPVDRVVIYGENGIWYDMISELYRLQKQTPTNPTLSKAWEKLLKDHVVQSSESVTIFK
ncbi:DUF928 domain-containing protein [Pseudanabaena sp. SR411]|uniref:DUF928 domain-containing protein n=1 Tax=Pseudanabaena sp. SR411 TaxID=1980935 RepID=UPI001595A203|nr:DUF928 domain-containing protein [Pseudanabaena sp. SR411]